MSEEEGMYEAPMQEEPVLADAPIWSQGEDYDPREDPGPTRPEDETE